jgi:hypothetical protein
MNVLDIISGVAICLGLTGCGIGVSSDPGQIAIGSRDAGGSSDADTAHDSGVPSACAGRDSPVHTYTQQSELEALLIGKWLHCSGPPMISSSEAGIELVDDHTYFKLVADGHGGYMRTVGFGNQGTWDTYQVTETSVQFDWHPTPNGGYGGYPSFEEQPRKMAILIVEQRDTSIYMRDP